MVPLHMTMFKTIICHPYVIPPWLKNYFDLEAVKMQQAHTQKALSTLPNLLKGWYKFSFYWRQTLISPERHQQNLQTHLTPLVSSHKFNFPQFAALGRGKLLSSILTFIYKCIVLFWIYYISCHSKQPLWVTFCLGFSSLTSIVHINKFCFSLGKLPLC